MKITSLRRRTWLALASVGLVALLMLPVSTAGAHATGDLHPRPVATFTPGAGGSFAESLAINARGSLFASVTDFALDGTTEAAHVWKIGPSGVPTSYGPVPGTGTFGILAGLAFDSSGRLYVADAAYGTGPAPGVFLLHRQGPPTRLATLPREAFPNGLAYRAGKLYVSDSVLGAVWRIPLSARGVRLTTPWFRSPILDPDPYLGANGLAFRGRSLFVSVADAGRIVRIRIRDDGTPGAVSVVAHDAARLASADGIAFDVEGGLWITANGFAPGGQNGGSIVRLTPGGDIRPMAIDPVWLDYPTMPVFGTARGTHRTLFVTNGSYYNGAPDIVSVHVAFRGARVPA